MANRPINSSADGLFFRAGVKKFKGYNSSPSEPLTLNSVSAPAGSLSGSFRFDTAGSALKSSQQLNVDFSNFSQHTFFNSALAKTQKAFDRIINHYPFDGKKGEVVAFIDSLTGFEKYVWDNFPTHAGYLHFSGSALHEDGHAGTFLQINDFKGTQNLNLVKDPTGESVLSPRGKPFTIEFHFSSPTIENDNQVIMQKKSSGGGITIFLSESASTQTANVVTMISSGSTSISSSMAIDKGKFNHIAAVYENTSGPGGQIKLYKDSVLKSSSSFALLSNIDFITSPLMIGTGTIHDINGYSMVPAQTLSGAMDDVRFWHKAKKQIDIRKQSRTEIFAQDDLKLMLRFNEPSGSYASTGGSLALDASGNGLHTAISNFNMNLRNVDSFGAPPTQDHSRPTTIALFPSFRPLLDLNARLLNSASQYDFSNPNTVTKLIPPHYFQNASEIEGFENDNGALDLNIVTAEDQPGGAVVGQPQIIAGILYTFAETFDELKLFVDEFKKLLKVDVIETNTLSNHLLPWLMRYYGLQLPNFFSDADISQFLDGENVKIDGTRAQSLQRVRNLLWRRIFSDLPYLNTVRGTHAGIRSILANLGIKPDGPIRIKEFGGAKNRVLGDSYIKRQEIAAMLDMSGTFSAQGTLNPQGIDNGRPFLQSSFLSGSRVEIGQPLPQGTLDSVGSSVSQDGFMTSGSWSFEGRYKFPANVNHLPIQSLVRLHSTGTTAPASGQAVLFNLIAKKPSNLSNELGQIQLIGRPGSSATAEKLSLILTGVNIFDGSKWQVSFGRDRNDLISSYVSSSYFLRASKMTPAGLEKLYLTSTYYDEGAPASNALQSQGGLNTSGTFLVVGSQSIDTTAARFLNDTNVDSLARETNFTGYLSNLRFYSKGLSVKETKTHAKNFKSVGVEDPERNFNFVTTATGSFERLRLDVSFDQPITESAADGTVTGFDFSQNDLTFAGTGFEPSTRIIRPERFDFEVLSHDFHSGQNPNKIRVRSFQDASNVENFDAYFAPLHDIPQNEQPNDSRKIAIEISAVQGLSEDIMNIFATMDALDNIIGSPELVFAVGYPRLRNLRRIYFNRLTQKVNHQAFFEFFKFFDDEIGILVEQMLPYDANFKGTTYVIESHALERPKFTYSYYDMYLGEENRGPKDPILLQLLAGVIRKM